MIQLKVNIAEAKLIWKLRLKIAEGFRDAIDCDPDIPNSGDVYNWFLVKIEEYKCAITALEVMKALEESESYGMKLVRADCPYCNSFVEAYFLNESGDLRIGPHVVPIMRAMSLLDFDDDRDIPMRNFRCPGSGEIIRSEKLE